MKVIEHAYQNQRKIDRPSVELPNGEKNPAQIFREPFTYKLDKSDLPEKAQEARKKMLAQIESALIDGVPAVHVSRDYPVRTLGGVRHWLGRDLGPEDEIAVAVLYPMTLKLAVGEYDLFNDYTQLGEWITEISLWVKAGDQKEQQ